MSTRQTDREDREEVFGGRLWTLILFGAVIAVFIVAAVGGKIAARHHNAPAAAPSGPLRVELPSPAATPSASGAAPAAPLTAPPPVTWTLWDKVALPVTAADPRTLTDRSAGFSDTPTGALLAAVHGFLRAGRGTPAEQAAEIRQAFAGPAAAQLLRSVPIPQLAAPIQVAGFRMPAYTPGMALIDLALLNTTASRVSYVEVELPLAWDGGDWRIAFNGPPAPVQNLGGLDGFIPFSGVR